MSRYFFLITGIGLFVGSFFLENSMSNQVGNSIVGTLRIMGGGFILLPVLFFFRKRYRHKKRENKKVFFLEKGIPATATLVSAERTGVFLNKIPQFLFVFKVSSSEREVFTTSEKKYIRFVDLSEISDGMKIPAYLHPADEHKIFLLWEKIGIGNAF